jgi:hypothetical protein
MRERIDPTLDDEKEVKKVKHPPKEEAHCTKPLQIMANLRGNAFLFRNTVARLDLVLLLDVSPTR